MTCLVILACVLVCGMFWAVLCCTLTLAKVLAFAALCCGIGLGVVALSEANQQRGRR